MLFVLISGLLFGQDKQLFKTVSYNDVISLYNATLKLERENLSDNFERCKYIIKNAKKNGNNYQLMVFNIFLEGLTEAEKSSNRSMSVISVYKDSTSYNFYESSDKFVKRIYKEKFDNTLSEKGDYPETYIESYFI